MIDAAVGWITERAYTGGETQLASQSQIHNAPFFQNGLQAKSGFEMCFGLGTLGAGAKTRLHTPKAVTYHEFRLKEFTPHCVYRLMASTKAALMKLPARTMTQGLYIKFDGESGLDYGGLQREFFYLISHEIFHPFQELFEYAASQSQIT